VQPEDNFIALGGDSLAAVLLATQIEDELGASLEAVTVLESENFRSLAQEIPQAEQQTEPNPSGNDGHHRRNLVAE
jgi:acyl carrier protein